jgi:hypothetical protein
MGLAAITIMLWLIVFNSENTEGDFVNINQFISNDKSNSNKD